MALLLLGISLDELAMGFSIGPAHLSITLAVVLIGAQAFLAAQPGLRLGNRLGHTAAELAERLAGIALLALAALLLAENVAYDFSDGDGSIAQTRESVTTRRHQTQPTWFDLKSALLPRRPGTQKCPEQPYRCDNDNG